MYFFFADSSDLPAEDGPPVEDDSPGAGAATCPPYDHKVPGG